MQDRRQGILFGVACYGMWGLFTLYWPLLKPAGAMEIMAHRIAWSLLVMVIIMTRVGTRGWLSGLGRRKLGLLVLAAALISVNWTIYIWAVNSRHVVETSLGYFMNPLVSMLLGVFFLGERVRRAQWVAIGVVALAVTVLTLGYGRPPWIALTLAISFGLYGFVKKKAGVGAPESLTVETGLLFLPALGYLLWLEMHGAGTFGHISRSKDALLFACGVITAVPLLCFAAAANRIPLTTLGFLQYLSPSLQFFLGVAVGHEEMPPARWVGFALMWTGLAIYSIESIVHRRRDRVFSPDVHAAAHTGR